MKKYLFITVLVIFFVSCRQPKEEIPADVLPIEKMVPVMIDIHLVEAAVSSKNLPRDSSIIVYDLYEKDVFKKYSIQDSIYRKSFNYYTSHPALMDKLYEMVVDSLSLREEQKRF
jgi:hypothetical protein